MVSKVGVALAWWSWEANQKDILNSTHPNSQRVIIL